MSQRKSDFAFPLNCILHIFLYDVLFGFATKNLLNLQHAWAVRIPNGVLDEVPHPFTLLLIHDLLDVLHTLVLLLCLCINETVSQVYLPETFGLLLKFYFSNLAVSETIFQLLHG
jgi:hypothetical protein